MFGRRPSARSSQLAARSEPDAWAHLEVEMCGGCVTSTDFSVSVQFSSVATWLYRAPPKKVLPSVTWWLFIVQLRLHQGPVGQHSEEPVGGTQKSHQVVLGRTGSFEAPPFWVALGRAR